MMTNAGRSRNLGIQAEADYRNGGFHSRASWGWNDARFIDFKDGNNDYSGNRVPYSPEHTAYLGADYTISLPGSELRLQADVRAAGPFCWSEAGTR